MHKKRRFTAHKARCCNVTRKVLDEGTGAGGIVRAIVLMTTPPRTSLIPVYLRGPYVWIKLFHIFLAVIYSQKMQ